VYLLFRCLIKLVSRSAVLVDYNCKLLSSAKQHSADLQNTADARH